MTKEEMMALKLRAMMPYMQMHNIRQRVGPTVAPPPLSPEQADETKRQQAVEEVMRLKGSM